MQPFKQFATAENAFTEHASEKAKKDSQSFAFNDSVLEWLEQNPALLAEFEKRNEKRIQQRVDEHIEAVKAQAVQEGLELGRKQGFEEGQQQLAQAIEVVKHIGEGLLKEKHHILHMHEKVWTDALSHLLRRFMIAEPEKKVEAVSKWLTETIETLGATEGVVVRVGTDLYPILQRVQSLVGAAEFKLVLDSDLKADELYCETSQGGAYYFASGQLAKLEELCGIRPRGDA